MVLRRLPTWSLFVAIVGVVLAGCEPYMSMTDRIPAQTRTATALLPEAPRYAGMVDLETVMGQIDELGGASLADSLRQTDSNRLRAFLEATGMDPETDLKAVYGAVGGESSFSAVVFADLRPEQMDRYLERAPEGSGRTTTYRDVPVYHLRVDVEQAGMDDAPDLLSLAFVGNGTLVASTDAEAVQAMVDRHQSETGGLRGNEAYMTLVEKVGHESTAWLAGRGVLETAFRDSARDGGGSAPEQIETNRAGFERLLSGWADQVLGMSEGTSPLDDATGGEVEELKSQIREQAVSLTLADESIEGEVYLTMRDETSASQVVDVSKGTVAVLRLSDEEGEGLKGDLLDDVRIEQNGPVVHVQFAVARRHLRQKMDGRQNSEAARESIPSIHRVKVTVRRLTGITPDLRKIRVLRQRKTDCNLRADWPVFSTTEKMQWPAAESRG